MNLHQADTGASISTLKSIPSLSLFCKPGCERVYLLWYSSPGGRCRHHQPCRQREWHWL